MSSGDDTERRRSDESASAWDAELDAGEPPISDEELTALALASETDAPLSADAKPLALHGTSEIDLLPSWYMPPVVASVHYRYWRPIAIAIVFALVMIEAAGLCCTYGSLVIP